MNKPKILVAGSMNVDLAMNGIHDLPKWGESSFCDSYQYAAGGKGSNQAIAAAKLGADTYMAGCIGKDSNGFYLEKCLKEAGVHTDFIQKQDDIPTGLATMNIRDDGSYYSVYAPGANMKFTEESVSRALERQKFDLIIMQLEMPLETAYRIYETASKKNVKVFLDAGPAMHISLARFQGIFIISPNEAETQALTGITPDTDEHVRKAAEYLFRACSPEYVLLKLGSRGAALYDGSKLQYIRGYQVHAVDTTAAGDTFGAALSVEYCLGVPLEEAVKYGHAAAAICVTREGGQPSIPTKEETEAFFRKAGNYV